MKPTNKEDSKNPPTFIELKVEEAIKSDVGRGYVRISREIMEKNKLETGDVVQLEGKKNTGALVIPGRREDRGLAIIRMDGIIRGNVGASIGELVKVTKAKTKPARYLEVAPAEEGTILRTPGDHIRRAIVRKPVLKGDILTITAPMQRSPIGSGFDDIFSRYLGSGPPLALGEIRIVVVDTDPAGITVVTDQTRVKILHEAPKELVGSRRVTYEDIGGLGEEIKRVREMIELPMKHPQLFERLGIEPPKGVLLHGPPGTGKTLLAKAVASESGVNFLSLAGPEVMSKFYGESEQRIRKIFKDAEKDAPSILFIDEIDSIAPKREEVTGEVERRVVAQILASMDGLKTRGRVIVIGATNRPNALDPALRRPGRFDREIEIGVPDKQGRFEVLMVHTRGMPLAQNVDLQKLAARTHGFVGADIAALAKEAAMHTLRRILPEIKFDETIPTEIIEKLTVTYKDFEEALKATEPSAMREVMIEIPNVKWEDIGGLEEVKQKLREAVEWPISRPNLFTEHGVRAPRGILLYGPPGTGKTLLAQAVANESEANFIAIRGPEVLSKWVGESERAIREVFRKAKQSAPSIIFLDEIDSIAPQRGMYAGGSHSTETIVNQLLTLLNGIENMKQVVVIAATNRPDIIDPALLRPGRFDRLVYVGAPNKEERYKILLVHTKDMKIDPEFNLLELSTQMDGYVGADIENICREAVMIALRRDLNSKMITREDFLEAMKVVHPSVNKEILDFYETMKKRLLNSGLLSRSDGRSYVG
ncbi:MAG: CDC48 family AAA ATPase [Promethearchaeota archaeon]